MFLDARAAKALLPGSHIVVDGCPGLRPKVSTAGISWTYRYKSTVNGRTTEWHLFGGQSVRGPITMRGSAFQARTLRWMALVHAIGVGTSWLYANVVTLRAGGPKLETLSNFSQITANQEPPPIPNSQDWENRCYFGHVFLKIQIQKADRYRKTEIFQILVLYWRYIHENWYSR